jgi:CII-binding regulator of phage lambda lysogenization HflD
MSNEKIPNQAPRIEKITKLEATVNALKLQLETARRTIQQQKDYINNLITALEKYNSKSNDLLKKLEEMSTLSKEEE